MPYHVQFPGFGWEFDINPIAFSIGDYKVYWYGIIIACGLLLAVLYAWKSAPRYKVDGSKLVNCVFAGMITGIIGARLYFCFFKWDYYGQNPIEILYINNGGLAIYGGIIGALAVGLLICKLRKVKYLPMLDVTVLGLLIGQGVGRWGNFVNQEAFGTNTDFFLGMTGGRIQDTIISSTQIGGDMYNSGIEMYWEKTVHPCFLYESLWCLLGFVLLAWYSKRRKYDGQLLLMYMAWYGAERFVVEGLRTDSLYIGKIRVSQALSAIIFIVSVIIQIVMFFRIKRDPESYELYANTEESRLLIEETRRKKLGISAEDVKIDLDDESVFDDDDTDENGSDDESGSPAAESGGEKENAEEEKEDGTDN